MSASFVMSLFIRFSALGNDPVSFASLEVQIKTVETHGVGACTRPINIFEPVSAFGFVVFERKIAVLMQPCVQVDAARKRLEAVIGDDE